MPAADEIALSGQYPVRDLERYPWHATLWRQLSRDFSRMPHALLLQGRPGLAKTAFALRLTQALVCESPDANRDGCGRCRGCLLFAAGTHPDVRFVFVEEDRTQISIDQVRAVIEFLSLKPHAATRRVAIFSPANAMNASAANALLKTLEEPPGGLLMLVSSQPELLPATIRSRCARIEFSAPVSAQATDWLSSAPRNVREPAALLRLASGLPQRALQYHESGFLRIQRELLDDLAGLLSGQANPLDCAQRWQGIGGEAVLAWLYGAFADLIRLSMMRDAEALVTNTGLSAALGNRINTLNVKDLYIILQLLSDSTNLLRSSLDELLLLEETAIRIARLANRSATMKTQTI
jgi:DNA polymerase-3 subunit delta'